MRFGFAEPSLQSLLSTVFRLFGRQNRQQNGQHGQGENVPSDVTVLQPPHHLELHSSAKGGRSDQAGAGGSTASGVGRDPRQSIFGETVAEGVVRHSIVDAQLD